MREECLTVGRRETAQMASCCRAACSRARSRQHGTRTHWDTAPAVLPSLTSSQGSLPQLLAGPLGSLAGCCGGQTAVLGPAGPRQAVNSVSPCYWHPGADLPTTLTWTGSKCSRNAAEQGVCVVSARTVAFDVLMAEGRVWKPSLRMGL